MCVESAPVIALPTPFQIGVPDRCIVFARQQTPTKILYYFDSTFEDVG